MALRDLNAEPETARRRFVFSGTDAFSEALREILLTDPRLMLDRDSGEREDRARCEDGDGALCCMLHSRIGIAFVRGGMLSESTLAYLSRFHVVGVDSFAADEWRLDPGALRSVVPEIGWHTCPEAVEPSRMSLGDLYYATV